MNNTRARLKKGTFLWESQSESGQWWRTTVVRDTGTVFKAVTHRIDTPSGEAPLSASQNHAPRKTSAKKSASKKAITANATATLNTKLTEKRAKRALGPETRNMIPKTQRNHSAAQRSAAKRAVPLSAKAPKKSAANNTQGREA